MLAGALNAWWRLPCRTGWVPVPNQVPRAGLALAYGLQVVDGESQGQIRRVVLIADRTVPE